MLIINKKILKYKIKRLLLVNYGINVRWRLKKNKEKGIKVKYKEQKENEILSIAYEMAVKKSASAVWFCISLKGI